MLDGIFIGATRTRDMRNMMAVSAIIYAAAVVVLTPFLGNHGLWAALNISFVARGRDALAPLSCARSRGDRAAA
jgi:multidrug resistance protein, MATE family